MSEKFEAGYNERLFSGGLRRRYHMARFDWLKRQAAGLPRPLRVLEVGCFDGRALSHLPPVERYLGLDANWEGGLDEARKAHAGRDGIGFRETTDPAVLREEPDGAFNLTVSLETLEHIDPAVLPAYLSEMARVTRGTLLVTVPNETGVIFLAKYLAKRAVYGDAENYSWKEVGFETLGRTDRVERREHKGFNYRDLVAQIREYFEIVSVGGLSMPANMSLSIGIVAQSR